MTRAPCRRRTGEAPPRAEKVWYKILPLNGVTLFRAKRKLLRRRKGVYDCFSHRRESRKSFTFTIHWSLANLLKTYHGIIVPSTPHRSEANEIAERAARRVKERTSAVLPQSGLDEKWWADSMECNFYLRNVQDLLPDGKTPNE